MSGHMHNGPHEGWSDERLNALVDGELTPADADSLLAAVARDPALRQRVCDLQLAKELVRHAYAGVESPAPAAGRAVRSRPWRLAAALAVVFVTGGTLGWGVREAGPSAEQLAGAVLAHEAATRLILHVATNDPAAGQATLARAQAVLEAARAAGRSVDVEIVANGPGLDLLRADVSAQGASLAALQAAHPGLSLVACGQTVQKLRDAGVTVQLLPGTLVASSALDEIVRRLEQGWTYLRI